MADELKDIIDTSNTQEPSTEVESDVKNENNRAEDRIRDLASKYKTAAEESAAKDKKIKEMEFEMNFKDQSSKYPYAKDHRDDIKKMVDGGMTLEDATTLVLAKNKQFVTSEELNKPNAVNTFGGSATVNLTPDSGKKDPKTMTQEERLAALREAEVRGELFIN